MMFFLLAEIEKTSFILIVRSFILMGFNHGLYFMIRYFDNFNDS